MLNIITDLIALIVTLGILVTFHEYGHFWVARRCGVKVLRFSVGFGKPIKSWWGQDGVEYAIAPIPLGGYVKMLGQEDMAAVPNPSEAASEEERQKSFAYKPLSQRTAIVAAGPLANFLLAGIVFWVIHVVYGSQGVAPVVGGVVAGSPADVAGLERGDEIIAVDGEPTQLWRQVGMQLLERMGESGTLELTVSPEGSTSRRDLSIPINAWMGNTTEPNPLGDLGILRFRVPALISEVSPGSRAEAAGMQVGDEIVAVNGRPIQDWWEWTAIVQASPEVLLDVTLRRDGGIQQLSLRPARQELDDGRVQGLAGVAAPRTVNIPPEHRREMRYNPVSALAPALQETWDMTLFVLDSVGKLVVGTISAKNINGPITIAQVAGDTASYGLETYLGFLALLSISLGVLNLLPIPILDGGHLLFFAIEAVTRRPVPERVQAWGLNLGLLLVGGIMALAFYNDFARLL